VGRTVDPPGAHLEVLVRVARPRPPDPVDDQVVGLDRCVRRVVRVGEVACRLLVAPKIRRPYQQGGGEGRSLLDRCVDEPGVLSLVSAREIRRCPSMGFGGDLAGTGVGGPVGAPPPTGASVQGSPPPDWFPRPVPEVGRGERVSVMGNRTKAWPRLIRPETRRLKPRRLRLGVRFEAGGTVGPIRFQVAWDRSDAGVALGSGSPGLASPRPSRAFGGRAIEVIMPGSIRWGHHDPGPGKSKAVIRSYGSLVFQGVRGIRARRSHTHCGGSSTLETPIEPGWKMLLWIFMVSRLALETRAIRANW
jgi:hypothetical protein